MNEIICGEFAGLKDKSPIYKTKDKSKTDKVLKNWNLGTEGKNELIDDFTRLVKDLHS